MSRLWHPRRWSLWLITSCSPRTLLHFGLAFITLIVPTIIWVSCAPFGWIWIRCQSLPWLLLSLWVIILYLHFVLLELWKILLFFLFNCCLNRLLVDLSLSICLSIGFTVGDWAHLVARGRKARVLSLLLGLILFGCFIYWGERLLLLLIWLLILLLRWWLALRVIRSVHWRVLHWAFLLIGSLCVAAFAVCQSS